MNTKIARIVTAGSVGFALLASSGSAFAQNVSVGTTVNADATVSASADATKIANTKSRADTEITNRIASMNALVARVSAAKYVSADESAMIAATLQNQITSLTSFKATVDAETDATALKTDVQSITKSYRVYALVNPQAMILAMADRVGTIVADMQELGGKLQTRISAAGSAGANVSVAQSAYADYTAKITDASAQAQAAVSETASLAPDGGNATLMASNTTSLKDARSKLQTARQDLIAARADIATIIKNLPVQTSASASASTTVQ